MKKRILFISLSCFVLIGAVSSCKTSDSVWDPTGTWNITFTHSCIVWEFNETLTFTGNEAGGSVSGYTYDGYVGPQTGTWTKTGDYSLSFMFQFDAGDFVTITAEMTATDIDPNSMTGTGVTQEDTFICNFTASGQKTSNLE